ncbi:MAG: histidine kinase [Bacteroidota bacterium]
MNLPNRKSLLIEILIWLVVYFLLLLVFESQEWKVRMLISAEAVLFFILLSKITSLWLAPGLLVKGRRVLFILLVCTLTFSSYIVTKRVLLTKYNGYTYTNFENLDDRLIPRRKVHFIVLQLISITTVLSSTVIHAYTQNRDTQRRMMQIEIEKKGAELKLLRTQFSPHFLLNTLNSLYAVIITKPEKSRQHVERIISLMKYLSYDRKEQKIELYKELEFIDNYIFFLSEKEDDSFQVHKEFKIIDSDVKIEPQILLPFVENAFKHSYHPVNRSSIEIYCKQIHQDFLFEVRNTKSDFQRSKKEQGYFGMGIDTTIQIIQSVYGNNAELNIVDQTDQYIVSLSLKQFFAYE